MYVVEVANLSRPVFDKDWMNDLWQFVWEGFLIGTKMAIIRLDLISLFQLNIAPLLTCYFWCVLFLPHYRRKKSVLFVRVAHARIWDVGARHSTSCSHLLGTILVFFSIVNIGVGTLGRIQR